MRIERNYYINQILPFMNKPVIKILTGMRRVGKSTIIKLIIEKLLNSGIQDKDILYINKESIKQDFISDYKELYNYIIEYFKENNSQKKYIFIDEVQEVKEWERTVNSILADSIADIIITGSNAHLLASDLATFLSGRYIEFKIYPLTFSEFLDFRGENKYNLNDNFNLFLRYGGLPGIHNFDLNDEMIFPYLNSIYNTLILKDVVSKNYIKEPAQLDLITRFVFDNCGNISTAKRISDYLKNQKVVATVDKVINYLSYLETAFLVRKVNRFDIKGLKVLEIYEKYYAGDIGLRHGFLGYKDSDISGIIENVVYLELLKRGYKVNIGKYDDFEIDFIAEKQDERLYIQVAYLLPDRGTIDREFRVLKKIRDNYPKIVLTMDEFQKINRNGIKSMYLIDFLLNQK